jgi:hypothetical protein
VKLIDYDPLQMVNTFTVPACGVAAVNVIDMVKEEVVKLDA